MLSMETRKDQTEENKKMLDTHIKQFIDTARQHFFGLISVQHPLREITPRPTH